MLKKIKNSKCREIVDKSVDFLGWVVFGVNLQKRIANHFADAFRVCFICWRDFN